MWRCPYCREKHDGVFDVCWKCGSDAVGNSEPGFCSPGVIIAQDQTPDAPVDSKDLPSLELPTVTYVCLPLFVWTCLIIMFHDLESLSAGRVPDSPLSPSRMAAYGITTILIGIPMFFTIVRAAFPCIMRRQIPSSWMVQVLWMLSMFQLPERLRRTQRWFVPLYYGSMGALLIAPMAFCAWRLARFI